MAYRFRQDESVADGARRIIGFELESALQALRDARVDGSGLDRAVHESRKGFKKIRAVLRIVRASLPSDVFDRENHTYRDAGRALARMREAAVAPGVLAQLRDEFGAVLHPEAYRIFETRLEARHRRVVREDRADGLTVALDYALEGSRRLPGLALDAGGWKALGPSLRKVYKRGRNRMRDAYAHPTGPRFHEWRKRVKYLWHQLTLLGAAWPPVMDPWAEEVHQLADYLGDGNDYSDMLRLIEAEPDLVAGDAPRRALAGLLRQRRRELWEAARPLGQRVFADPPDAFVDRLEGIWKAWRAGGCRLSSPTP